MPTTIKENGINFIGKLNFRGNDKTFGIKAKDRRQHLYVIGKTGTGKTTLLENMVLQDIHAGRGMGVIDPHGEFIDDHVLPQIPASRINDVIYFNPVDDEYPIGFNVLEVPDPKYKHLVVSNLLAIFTKIWANVWSARMEYILQNCILALLDTPGTTLLGIPRLLVDKNYRQKIVANVKDPVVKSFWIHEYETWRDQFRNEAIVPIQNKVGQFLNTGFIRNIVGQAKSTLNIPEIMNEGKILLVNVSKGKIGEDNSQLLGAMIITTIQLAAMERVRIPEEERKDFYLYVDEFQNFATDSFASILSEARKYRLNITIAHQYVGQLITDVSTKVRDAVFGNVGTMITFRIGAADAEFLEKEFMPEFLQQDLIGLPNYHIYLKLMVDGITSRPFSAVTLSPLKFETDLALKEKIITTSREHYASQREEVEEKITSWSGLSGEEEEEEGGGVVSAGGTTLHETTCWNCGKTATVPFKPDGKRPVYCQICLKQIEEGKLIPLPERMPQLSAKAKFSSSLGALGIEFEEDNRERSREKIEEEAERPADVREFRPEPEREFRGRDYERRSPVPTLRREIEYREAPRPGFRSQKAPMGDYRGNPRHEPEKPKAAIRILPQGKPISLSELKSREGDRQVKKPPFEARASSVSGISRPVMPDASELKKALEEALKDSVPSVKPSNTILAVPLKAGQETNVAKVDILGKSGSQNTDDKKIEKVIEPGETVKF